MRKLSSKSGFAPLVAGAALLLQLSVIGLLFSADDDLVYFLGHPIHYVCAARQRYGIPCPTCGLTRGFVLTIHGKIGDAWRLSPTGPLASIGMFGTGVILLSFGFLQTARPRLRPARIEFWLRAGVLSYCAASVAIWATSWLSTILRMRGHP